MDDGSLCRGLPSLHSNLGEETETMCITSPRKPRTMVRVETARKIYEKVQPFTYLLFAVTESPEISIEIARRTNATECASGGAYALRPAESGTLTQDPNGKGQGSPRPTVKMAVGGPVARNITPNSAPYTIRVYFASSGHSARDHTPPDDLVQPCP